MDRGHPLYARHGHTFDEVGEGGFEAFFDGPADRRVRLEATTHHVFQDNARNFVSKMNYTPHLILLLREPAQRIRSSFTFTRDNLGAIAPSYSFDCYVEMLLAAATKDMAPHFYSASSLWVLQRELLWSDYIYWLNLWRNIVPPENLHVVLFEDMKLAPAATMGHLLQRLGLEPIRDPVVAHKNESVRIGHHWLHRLARRVNLLIPNGATKALLRQRYLAFQERSARGEEDYRQGLEALRRYFAPANISLAQHYQLDLRKWQADG